jgi:hypothetical protein
MKKIGLIALMLFQIHTLSAQKMSYNTCIQLNYAAHHMTKAGMILTPDQVGLAAIVAIDEDFSIDLSGQYWFLGESGGIMMDLNFDEQDKVGVVKFKHSFKFIESSVRYNLTKGRRNLYGGLGMSTAFGKEEYISSVSNVAGYLDKELNLKDRPATYIGANILIGYNYYLFKNRINIGTTAKYRVMSKQVRYFDVSFNIGYNFNSY